MDVSAGIPFFVDDGRPAFTPGVASRPLQGRKRYRLPFLPTADSCTHGAFISWHARPSVAPGLIRMLTPPASDDFLISRWFWKDATLTTWQHEIDTYADSIQMSSICRTVYPDDYIERLRSLFATNQRRRMLFKMVLARLRNRIWSRRPACNMDLITMDPIPPADAIELMDTTNRCIFRFHRNDVFKTLMANLSHSDEMLPMPRQPTNPYTNAPLTLAQTLAMCQRLVGQFAARGSCPPPLLAAFWAARFDLRRFHTENTAALSQQAIHDYFRDLHDDNIHTVRDTMMTLLIRVSPTAIRRWLETPHPTPLHREWLTFCRDYTLYLNLHVQMRPHWYAEEIIYSDAAALARRTPFPRLAPLLPLPLQVPPQPVPSALTMTLLDVSGNMSIDQALEFIQSALLRL